MHLSRSSPGAPLGAALLALLVSAPAEATPSSAITIPRIPSAALAPMPCTPVPAVGNPELQYLSGGLLRRPYVWRNPSDAQDTRVWIGEDGGRIRYSGDGGATWTFQQTPFDAAQMLLDVVFLDDGLTGWATGLGGKILETPDGGATWSHLNPSSPILNAKDGNPGVFWGVRFLPDFQQAGWVCGLWSFFVTVDGGSTWNDVKIFRNPGDTVPLDPADFEFYCLEINGTLSGGFTGVVGANWETNLPSGVTGKLGVVFHTDSTDPQSNLGRRWWITLEEPGAQFNDPWDFDFENDTDGYLVGGTGTGNGSVYRTTDGGRNWSAPESIHPSATVSSFAALYGVADLGGGKAVASGYAGNIWVRDRVTGTWIDRFVPGFTAPLMGAEGIVGPTTEAWVTGSFGFLRATSNYGTTWTTQNNGEYLVRGKDVHFLDRSNGFVVGQPDQVFRTSDGGCTFTKVYPASGFGPKPNLSGIDFANSLDGIAVGHAGNVVRTFDGGFTWSDAGVSGVASNVHLEDVTHRQGGEYWAVGRQGALGGGGVQTAVVLATTNGGSSWSPVGGLPQTTGVTLTAVAFDAQNRAFVTGARGVEARAFLYDASGFPAWSDVSPVADPALAPRGLLDVDTGTVLGSPSVYACGQSGTLLAWNDAANRFEGVTGVYQFDVMTGAVSLQTQVHDFSAIGIASSIGHVLVGNNTRNHLGLDPEEDTVTIHELGYALRFDGTSWQNLRIHNDKNIRAIDFVEDRGDVAGFVLGGGGPGGITFGTLADSEVTLYEPQ